MTPDQANAAAQRMHKYYSGASPEQIEHLAKKFLPFDAKSVERAIDVHIDTWIALNIPYIVEWLKCDRYNGKVVDPGTAARKRDEGKCLEERERLAREYTRVTAGMSPEEILALKEVSLSKCDPDLRAFLARRDITK